MFPPLKFIPGRPCIQTPDCATFWLGLALAVGSLSLTPVSFAEQAPPAAAGVLQNFGNVPLQFEANGQVRVKIAERSERGQDNPRHGRETLLSSASFFNFRLPTSDLQSLSLPSPECWYNLVLESGLGLIAKPC